MIKELSSDDVVVRPFKVYKEWSFSNQDQDEVPLYFASEPTGTFADDSLGETSNGIYKSTIL
jgi:hypothetical protein